MLGVLMLMHKFVDIKGGGLKDREKQNGTKERLCIFAAVMGAGECYLAERLYTITAFTAGGELYCADCCFHSLDYQVHWCCAGIMV